MDTKNQKSFIEEINGKADATLQANKVFMYHPSLKRDINQLLEQHKSVIQPYGFQLPVDTHYIYVRPEYASSEIYPNAAKMHEFKIPICNAKPGIVQMFFRACKNTNQLPFNIRQDLDNQQTSDIQWETIYRLHVLTKWQQLRDKKSSDPRDTAKFKFMGNLLKDICRNKEITVEDAAARVLAKAGSNKANEDRNPLRKYLSDRNMLSGGNLKQKAFSISWMVNLQYFLGSIYILDKDKNKFIPFCTLDCPLNRTMKTYGVEVTQKWLCKDRNSYQIVPLKYEEHVEVDANQIKKAITQAKDVVAQQQNEKKKENDQQLITSTISQIPIVKDESQEKVTQ